MAKLSSEQIRLQTPPAPEQLKRLETLCIQLLEQQAALLHLSKTEDEALQEA